VVKQYLMFCREFEEFVYDRFRSYVFKIFILGSAKRGEWIYGRSDIDVVIILRRKGVESLIYKYYWYLDLKHGTNMLNIPFYHPPIIFVRNSLDYKLTFTNLVYNRSLRLSIILKSLLHHVAPRTKYLKPWITKHPVLVSKIFLILLLPVKSLAKKLDNLYSQFKS